MKEGDIVYLNSGGPAMSIRQVVGTVEGKDDVVCNWFAADQFQQAVFKAWQLVAELPQA